jgi:hypothetical protein
MKLHEQKNDYFALLSKTLEQQYCINFNDTGYTEGEWLAYFEDLTIDEAIMSYSQKYDLTPIGDVTLTKHL